jgi:hypothetical protein
MSEEKLTFLTDDDSSESESQAKGDAKQEIADNKVDFKKNPEAFLKSYLPDTKNPKSNFQLPEKEKPQNTSELTGIELEAYRQGWRPKEIYEGNPDNWIPPNQYLKNGSFMAQNKVLADQVRQLTAEVKQLRDLSKSQARIFAEKRAEEAKRKRLEAFEAKNLEEMDKYQEEYQKYNEEAINYSKNTPIDPQSKPQSKSPPAEVMQFQARNASWFNAYTPTNAAMSTFATQTDEMLRVQHPEWSLERRLGEVEQAVRREFAHVFSNPARNTPSDVESKTPSLPKTNFPHFEELPHRLQETIDATVRLSKGKMTREKYIKQLREMGSI